MSNSVIRQLLARQDWNLAEAYSELNWIAEHRCRYHAPMHARSHRNVAPLFLQSQVMSPASDDAVPRVTAANALLMTRSTSGYFLGQQKKQHNVRSIMKSASISDWG
jgi:hypothetical protein